jgi:Kdo2-lipid IVA lauroyltransferase/acyltransferase
MSLSALGTYFGVGLAWLLHFLPMRVLAALGRGVGRLIYRFGADRRGVAHINLKLCFPALDETQRTRTARRNFRVWGRAFLEQPLLWWGSAERIERYVRIEGIEHWLALKGRPVIWFAPHFAGLDMGGVRLSIDHKAASVYRRQRNPVIDKLMLAGRSRFGPVLFHRHEGIRAIVKSLREGVPLYYLPDQDLGARDAIFVPFFGMPAATVTALARLARVADAKIVPLVTRQAKRGYIAQFYPAWENFPSGDLKADTRRMNEFVEARCLEMPEQYFWAHRRFKTRPPGAAEIYPRK